MPEQIVFEIDTNPVDFIQDTYDYLQSKIPGWEPSEGNLDVWLIEAFAEIASDVRDLASQVPPSIYRYYGATIAGIPPVDASSATTATTWTAIDTLGHTVLAGTLVGIRNAAGDLVAFEVVSDVTISPGSSVTTAGAVSISAVTPGADTSGLGGTGTPIELIDPIDWVSSVVTVAATIGGIDAEDDDAYLNRLRGQLQLMAPRPILPKDFAVLAKNIAGVGRSNAIDGYNPLHNLLSLNAASLETDTSGWFNDTNATLTRSVTQALDGVASLSIASTAAADAIAKSSVFLAAQGEVWTGLASFRANTTVRTVRVGLRWYSDVGGTTLISDTLTSIADVNTGWTNLVVSGTAPANTKSVRLILVTIGGAAGEVHFADKLSIRRGVGSDWVAGGTPETGNERMVAVALTDTSGVAASTTVKNNVQTYLDGLREANFIVSAIDPSYMQISVTATVKSLPGFLAADVQANVIAALQAYLNPTTWGIPADGDQTEWAQTSTVRYLELASVIDKASGVDYVVSLIFGQTGTTLAGIDVTLPGPAPLADDGTFNITVT